MKRLLVLILIFLAGCTSFAYEEHTDAGSKYVMNNGMTVLLKENPDTGMAAMDLIVKRSIAADENLPGLSHFTNRMLLAGTKTRTREQINAEIENAGGSISARTYAEYSEIMIEVPSDSISVAMNILMDVAKNPTFESEEIEKERTRILEEIASKKDQPQIMSEELFMRLMYAGHPYSNPIDGYEESVEKITKQDLIEHYKTWYVPNNMIISVVGNIREKPTAEAIAGLFGTMLAKETPIETIPAPQRTMPVIKKENMPIESAYIQYGHQLVPAAHPDFIKLRMANAVLGSGSGSRLFYHLRDEQALAYTVYSIAPSIRSTGFVKITMVSRPDVMNESIKGIRKELDRLKEEKVSEEEMKLVKQKIRGFFFLDHQKTADQANYLGFYEMQGLGYHYDVEYPDRIAAVSADEVQDVANKYFVNPQIAIVGPVE